MAILLYHFTVRLELSETGCSGFRNIFQMNPLDFISVWEGTVWFKTQKGGTSQHSCIIRALNKSAQLSALTKVCQKR